MSGMVSEGPTSPALRCESPLPSCASCSHTHIELLQGVHVTEDIVQLRAKGIGLFIGQPDASQFSYFSYINIQGLYPLFEGREA